LVPTRLRWSRSTHRRTELGTKLIKTYRSIEARAAQAADQDMQLLAAMVQKDAGPRAKGAGKTRSA
jgi:molybdenum-dependent DNA-binding transcriptional regulator ModE